MVKVFFVVACHKAFAAGCGFAWAGFHLVLEQHVHEHVHGFGFDHQGARWALVAGVKVLVHTVVVDHGDVAGFPVVANAVVNFVARAIQNVERGFVHVTVLLRVTTWAVLFQVHVESLRDAVFGLDVVAAESLWAIVEFDVLAFAHARHGAQALELIA
jgi:hypothetical protein